MDIKINDLLRGKPCLIKNKEFLATKNYVEPFLNLMSNYTNEFLVKVKLPDQMTMAGDSADVTYNRVWIQAVLPEKYTIDNHDEVLGMVYGIDVKNPIVKLYRGHLNRACTNLTVFDPQWLNTQELIPGDPINFNPVKELLERENTFKLVLEQMKNTFISREDRKEHLGHWVDFMIRESIDNGLGRVKLAVSTPIDAYKQLYVDTDSMYYIPEGIEPDLYKVYNSFTQVITNDSKDILNKMEKTLLINKMLTTWVK